MYKFYRYNNNIKYPKNYEQHFKNLYELIFELRDRVNSNDYVKAIVEELLNNKDFINALEKIVIDNNNLIDALLNDLTFLKKIADLTEDTLKNDTAFIQAIGIVLATNQEFLAAMTASVESNLENKASFIQAISDKLIASGDFADKAYVDTTTQSVLREAITYSDAKFQVESSPSPDALEFIGPGENPFLDMRMKKLTSLPEPTDDTDAVNKKYADQLVATSLSENISNLELELTYDQINQQWLIPVENQIESNTIIQIQFQNFSTTINAFNFKQNTNVLSSIMGKNNESLFCFNLEWNDNQILALQLINGTSPVIAPDEKIVLFYHSNQK